MTEINTKLPTDFVMRSIILAIIFIGVALDAIIFDPKFLTDESNYQSLVFIIIVLVALSFFDLYLRKGYRISYDEVMIYWRKVGLSRNSNDVLKMTFNEISNVYCIDARSPIAKIDAIGLRSKDSSRPDIIISTKYVQSQDIVILMDNIARFSGAKFDDCVLEFIDSF